MQALEADDLDAALQQYNRQRHPEVLALHKLDITARARAGFQGRLHPYAMASRFDSWLQACLAKLWGPPKGQSPIMAALFGSASLLCGAWLGTRGAGPCFMTVVVEECLSHCPYAAAGGHDAMQSCGWPSMPGELCLPVVPVCMHKRMHGSMCMISLERGRLHAPLLAPPFLALHCAMPATDFTEGCAAPADPAPGCLQAWADWEAKRNRFFAVVAAVAALAVAGSLRMATAFA